MEYIKKVDLLNKAVEVEYLGRPRLMVSVAKIGQMPSIEAVPMEYHNKVCEEMARRHQAEILELTKDRPQGEWIEVEEDWRHQIEFWKCSECDFAVSSMYNYCPHCGAKMFAKDTNVPNKKGADDESS